MFANNAFITESPQFATAEGTPGHLIPVLALVAKF